MSVNDVLYKYLTETYGDKANNITEQNELQLIFKETAPIYTEQYIINKVHEVYRKKVLYATNDLLVKHGITPIHFKGVTLSHMLYDDPYTRSVGDIDIYVNEKDYSRALEILFSNGYTLFEDVVGHHVSLLKDDICVEVHSNFVKDYIDFDPLYFTETAVDITVDNIKLKTLSVTATLIYLFYHNYMHLVGMRSYYNIDLTMYTFCMIEIYDAIYHRYYDAALLIEKYGDEILWDDFVDIIYTKSLHYEFGYIIQEFNNIFNLIPKDIYNKLINKDYTASEDGNIKYEIEFLHRKSYPALSNDELYHRYISDKWDSRMNISCPQSDNRKAIVQLSTYTEYISENDSTPEDISAYYEMNIDDENLYLTIHVTDNVLIFRNDLNNYQMAERYKYYEATDYIDIKIINSAGKYNYSGITLLPHYVNDGITVTAFYIFDGRCSDISESVKSEINLTDDDYIVKTSIALKYIQVQNQINNCFYIDVAIQDCDDVSVGRKTTLSSHNRAYAWYDPRGYCKVTIS